VIRLVLEIDLHLDVGDGDEYNKQTTLVRMGEKHIESDFNSKLGSGKGWKEGDLDDENACDDNYLSIY
jgi:hypothetical protein